MIEARKKRITKDFGQRLKKIRKEKKLSLRQLASEAELEHAQIARIEQGIINPTLTTIVLLAEALGVPSADLLSQ